MSITERFATAVTRVATATSVRRTRTEDGLRADSHGDASELAQRVLAHARSLEKAAQRLEAGA